MQAWRDELEELLLAWEDGTLDDAGADRLRALLRASEEARRQFARWQALNAALWLEGNRVPDAIGRPATEPMGGSAAEAGAERPAVVFPARDMDEAPLTRRLRRWRSLAVTAVALAIGVVSWSLWNGSARPSAAPFGAASPDLAQAPAASARGAAGVLSGGEGAESVASVYPSESRSRGVAVLGRVLDARWAPGEGPREAGDPLLPGVVRLDEGFAQIEFFSGATVVLQGPAELELIAADRAVLRRGRLRAHVPPAARGFTLLSADLQVVDLGTEFGVSVSEDGRTEVHVFDGLVEWSTDGTQPRRLSAGKALVRTGKELLPAGAAAEDRFVGLLDLQRQALDEHTERLRAWREWSKQLRRDPRLIAYYAFERQPDGNRRLVCDIEPCDPEKDGAIVGARWVDGRWPEKGALEFKRPGDRVRVHIPGEYESLTFAAWVKIDSLDRLFNSLFLTDHYDRGEPHWQILSSGQLYFSVRPVERGEPGPRDYKALSPPFWNPSLSGRWLHLATVYDYHRRTITHYLNGVRLSHHQVPAEQVVPTRIGTASIGNWSLPTLPDASFAIRNLNGSIDEFALFAAALSDEDIARMYALGRP